MRIRILSPEFSLLMIYLIGISIYTFSFHYYPNDAYVTATESDKSPILFDSNLKVEKVIEGLMFPTNMEFLSPNDILVTEKDNGTVRRIVNGDLIKEPLLDVNVANQWERGMLGMAISKNEPSNVTYVFLYYTEGETKDGEDVSGGTKPLGNRLYRYELEENKLTNGKLLLDLIATPNRHNGGPVVIGPDKNVYLLIGDINQKSQTQNYENVTYSNGTGVIYRISQDGKPVGNILSDTDPMNKIFAYGIRNSFGMEFDPVGKQLWDTENGLNYGDEVNLVQPGFNSGWSKFQGIWTSMSHFTDFKSEKRAGNAEDMIKSLPEGLVDFGGKGKYRSPEFTWNHSVGPTAIEFLDSKKLGESYNNDLFIGDFLKGNLYHFDLNYNRTGLVLPGSLSDKIANSADELKPLIFGRGFGGKQQYSHFEVSGITDIETGPDGYLYVLTFRGSLYKILPK